MVHSHIPPVWPWRGREVMPSEAAGGLKLLPRGSEDSTSRDTGRNAQPPRHARLFIDDHGITREESVRIRILGPLEVFSGCRWIRPGPPKLRAMLAALVAAKGSTVSTDRLIETVWSDSVPATASNLVHGHVARLRRLLGDPAGEILQTQSPGYRLLLPDGGLDSSLFEIRIKEGVAVLQDGRYEHAVKLLGDALGLWRGAPFADVPDPASLDFEVARLEQMRLTALEARADALAELGQYQELLPELRQLVESHPMHEPFWGQLMTALYRTGRRADCLAVYNRLRTILDAELGVQPGKAIQSIRNEVLGDGSAELGAERANHKQAEASETPHLLPPCIRGFTGRAGLLDQLDTKATDDAGDGERIFIIVITGLAGAGKSTLAIHWAHRISHKFPDGQLYIDLRGYAPEPPLGTGEAAREFLLSLGIPAQQIPQSAFSALSQYRSMLASRRMLVVLDNAYSVDQVRPLLAGSPGSVVVITSRNQLSGLAAVEGAHKVTVEAFTPEEAIHFLRRRTGTGRAGLRTESLHEINKLCDGLPLALAVVATRCETGSPSSLQNLLEDLRRSGASALDALTTADTSIDVRASFSWSCRALSEQACHLFRLLGRTAKRDVLAADAAELAGLAPQRARRLLDQLCCAGLLSEPAPGRYAMPGLLRAYASMLGT